MRRIFFLAALFAVLGVEPPIFAAVRPGPFRFSVITPADRPHYVLVRLGHGRKIVVIKSKVRRRRLV